MYALLNRIKPIKLLQSLVSRGLSTVFSFLLIFVLARLLSPEEYGLYALLFSIGSGLGLTMTVGQTTLLMKHFRADEAIASPINMQLIRENLLWLTVSLVLIALICSLLVASSEMVSPAAVLVVFLFASLFVLSEYAQSYFRARGRILTALLPRENVWRPIATAGLLLAGLGGLALSGVSALLIVTLCLGLIVGYQIAVMATECGRGLVTVPGSKSEPAPRATWRQESTYFSLNTLMTAVALHIEVLIVGLVLGLEEVALFFLMMRLTALLNLPAVSMETVAFPMVSERLRKGDTDGAQKLLAMFAAITFALCLIGVAVLVPLGPHIIALFNPELGGSSLLMGLMALTALIYAYFGLGTGALMLGGGERFFLIYRSILYVFYGAALALFGYIWGLEGIALTMAGGILIETLLAAWWCKRNLGIDISAAALIPVLLKRGTKPASGDVGQAVASADT